MDLVLFLHNKISWCAEWIRFIISFIQDLGMIFLSLLSHAVLPYNAKIFFTSSETSFLQFSHQFCINVVISQNTLSWFVTSFRLFNFSSVIRDPEPKNFLKLRLQLRQFYFPVWDFNSWCLLLKGTLIK